MYNFFGLSAACRGQERQFRTRRVRPGRVGEFLRETGRAVWTAFFDAR
jgi:hypothetical protein